VSTRKLILVAMVAGLAILVAGGIQLVGLSNRSTEPEPTLAVGERASVGGVELAVTGVDRDPEAIVVTVETDAADDAMTGLALIGSTGELVPRDEIECSTGCTVTFLPGDLDVSGALTVLYGRDDERASWVVS
jgi:hypothetical protein